LDWEKEYGIDRYKYFTTVWNIPAKTIVKKNSGLRKMLLVLKKKYRITLVSDAPKIWINNVLQELKVIDLFKRNIFTGEGNTRKGFGNAYNKVMKFYKLKAADCIAVGDQEKTDIIPAKKIGMLTVYISSSNKDSKLSDINMNKINLLPIKLNNFYKKNLRKS